MGSLTFALVVTLAGTCLGDQCVTTAEALRPAGQATLAVAV